MAVARALNFFFAVFILIHSISLLYVASTFQNIDRQQRIYGRDLIQFYIAGRIVADGEAERLYDQEHFLQIQEGLAPIDDERPRFYSLYAPTVALLFALPARFLPYVGAVWLWWGLMAIGYLWAGRKLIDEINPPPLWRLTAWLGLIAFHPLYISFWNCQLSFLWVLACLAGFDLVRRQADIRAGYCFSLLALKPQLLVGVAIWFLLRRSWRNLAGLALGLALQGAIVAVVLGPVVLRAYVDNMAIYAKLANLYTFQPDYQCSLSGMLVNVMGMEYAPWCRLAHLLVAGLSIVWLHLIVRKQPGARLEQAAVVLFMLVVSAHLLIYDVVLLLLPIAWLLASRRQAPAGEPLVLAALLYAAVALAPLYRFAPTFSLVPFALIGGLYLLARARPGWAADPPETAHSSSVEHAVEELSLRGYRKQ